MSIFSRCLLQCRCCVAFVERDESEPQTVWIGCHVAEGWVGAELQSKQERENITP